MKIFIAILLLSAIIFAGCSAQKNNKKQTVSETATPTKATTNVLPTGDPYRMLQFSKSPCMGKCPVYNLSINTDGTMEYKGRAHVSKIGKYAKQLSKTELTELYSHLKGMDLFQYENDYGGPIMDVPRMKLVYLEEDMEMTIVCKMGCPDELTQLFAKIDKIVDTETGWTLLEDRPEKPNAVKEEGVSDEVIVYAKKDIDINKWITDYSDYGLKVKKRLTPNGYIWLLQFDTKRASADEMVKLLKDDPDMMQVQTNKNIQGRN